MEAPNDDILILTHIPKTAGSTFNQIAQSSLQDRFGKRNFRQLNKESFCRKYGIKYPYNVNKELPISPKYVDGHFPFGIHNIFPTKNIKYVVFLRHPVKRYISCINHMYKYVGSSVAGARRLGKIYKEKDVIRMIKKFNDFIACDNSMVKFLSGYFPYKDILSNMIQARKVLKNPKVINDKSKRINVFVNLFFDKNERFYKEEEKWLSLAKNNLKKYYFVGFQERFRDDTLNLFKKLNSKVDKELFQVRAQETPKYFQERTSNEEAYSLISEINKWDMLLYNFAISNFHGQ